MADKPKYLKRRQQAQKKSAKVNQNFDQNVEKDFGQGGMFDNGPGKKTIKKRSGGKSGAMFSTPTNESFVTNQDRGFQDAFSGLNAQYKGENKQIKYPDMSMQNELAIADDPNMMAYYQGMADGIKKFNQSTVSNQDRRLDTMTGKSVIPQGDMITRMPSLGTPSKGLNKVNTDLNSMAGITDDMEFGVAFDRARKAGLSVFKWRNKTYGTDRAPGAQDNDQSGILKLRGVPNKQSPAYQGGRMSGGIPSQEQGKMWPYITAGVAPLAATGMIDPFTAMNAAGTGYVAANSPAIKKVAQKGVNYIKQRGKQIQNFMNTSPYLQ